jgi:uncharacterized membrane protein YukC
MKKIVILVALAFLLQSCFSYRIDTKTTDMIVGKKYKIQRDNKSSKVTIKSINDSTAVVMTTRLEETQISLKGITQVKKRKFSIVKTFALPITIAAVATLALAVSFQNGNIGMGEIQSPNKNH